MIDMVEREGVDAIAAQMVPKLLARRRSASGRI